MSLQYHCCGFCGEYGPGLLTDGMPAMKYKRSGDTGSGYHGQPRSSTPSGSDGYSTGTAGGMRNTSVSSHVRPLSFVHIQLMPSQPPAEHEPGMEAVNGKPRLVVRTILDLTRLSLRVTRSDGYLLACALCLLVSRRTLHRDVCTGRLARVCTVMPVGA